jgi:lysyl-tRNA synthetase class 2
MDETRHEELVRIRRDKLAEWRDGGDAFPNDFKPTHLASPLHEAHAEDDGEALEAKGLRVTVAGRMLSQRIMGKAAFAHLYDRSGRIQAFIRRNDIGEEPYAAFKRFDLGDIVGVTGTLIRTRTGELSVQAESVRLLVKCLVPPPEKFHGLTDVEARYRARHLDLAVNPEVREVFLARAAVIRSIRRFLDARGYTEVETPVLQPLYGGAAARPFKTHHHAFDTELYLRIATELYLKRLVAGGMERVYEIGKNFRNEGVDTQHNPEFTAIEFYEAYATYEDLMELTEEMVTGLVLELHGGTTLTYQGMEVDFERPWRRVSVRDALLGAEGVAEADLVDRASLARLLERIGQPVVDHKGPGGLLMDAFDALVEDTLIRPTFLTGFPAEVSPLARRSAADPEVVDRFELFIAGREIANAFSELNDPEDQRRRFEAQVEARDKGDQEAHPVDEDFLAALEWGMPPTAGEGIGIDRLVMLLTDSGSIRDVLLFPLLRPRAAE